MVTLVPQLTRLLDTRSRMTIRAAIRGDGCRRADAGQSHVPIASAQYVGYKHLEKPPVLMSVSIL